VGGGGTPPARMTAAWRSRIVVHAEVPPPELVPNPRNWRTHPAEQRRALTGALSEVGWVAEVLVNQTTGHVVDGHLRIELARPTRSSASASEPSPSWSAACVPETLNLHRHYGLIVSAAEDHRQRRSGRLPRPAMRKDVDHGAQNAPRKAANRGESGWTTPVGDARLSGTGPGAALDSSRGRMPRDQDPIAHGRRRRHATHI
jgi:hypothetical protein